MADQDDAGGEQEEPYMLPQENELAGLNEPVEKLTAGLNMAIYGVNQAIEKLNEKQDDDGLGIEELDAIDGQIGTLENKRAPLEDKLNSLNPGDNRRVAHVGRPEGGTECRL